MTTRYDVQIGKPCEKCGKNKWLVYNGHNRCACGQYLWIEKRPDYTEGVKFRYVQGPELPADYPGWGTVTLGGAGRERTAAQKEALRKAAQARWIGKKGSENH